MRQDQIDDQVFELFDEYCHGRMDRRDFNETADSMLSRLLKEQMYVYKKILLDDVYV